MCNMSEIIQEKVKKIIEQIHNEPFGFCELTQLSTLSNYKDWVEKNFHGEMAYLKDQIPYKESPSELLHEAHSVISFQFSYYPSKKNSPPFTHLRTSLYSQMEDYHFWVKEKLSKIINELQNEFSESQFKSFVDSSPLLEREMAQKAGLGWFGKNSCIIHPKKGSLFFLGEIYTSLKLKSFSPPVKDHCGSCDRCIKACPTEAILKNGQIDARKCISYLNIELKSLPSPELRSKMKDWFFGCDICQTVCPWNELCHEKHQMKELSKEITTPITPELIAEIKNLLSSSHNSLVKTTHGYAVSRARGFGIKRNAIIVGTNLKILELIPEVKKLQKEERYSELCTWSLKILDPQNYCVI